MPRTKKKSVCILKSTPVLTDNDDSDTVDNLATGEQHESEVLSHELLNIEKKKRGMPRR